MQIIGIWAVPVVIGLIITVGLCRGVRIFDCFLEGARDGLKSLIGIIPSLAGLIVAVEMFKASGAMDVLSAALAPATDLLGFPREAVPMAILRPVSGGGSLALLDRILQNAGADSLAGRTAAVMCGSSETTFYTVAVYYGSCGVSRIRYTLLAALLADGVAALASAAAVRLLFPG